jgi:EAL domain-containing protein (putative c-di-GMP-specific phosphodiesterase class I)
VNLSACQLADPDLVGLVADTLERYRLPAPALTLEITETLLMHDTAVTLARLLALKQLGVRLAIDDFGTGYSSLGYLRRFPIDILKIDKCFIDNITAPGEDSALARTIVKLGQTLRLTTVAEGIEEADQARLLRQLGCDLGQGFHFARPMPAADFDALVHGQPQAATAGP